MVPAAGAAPTCCRPTGCTPAASRSRRGATTCAESPATRNAAHRRVVLGPGPRRHRVAVWLDNPLDVGRRLLPHGPVDRDVQHPRPRGRPPAALPQPAHQRRRRPLAPGLPGLPAARRSTGASTSPTTGTSSDPTNPTSPSTAATRSPARRCAASSPATPSASPAGRSCKGLLRGLRQARGPSGRAAHPRRPGRDRSALFAVAGHPWLYLVPLVPAVHDGVAGAQPPAGRSPSTAGWSAPPTAAAPPTTCASRGGPLLDGAVPHRLAPGPPRRHGRAVAQPSRAARRARRVRLGHAPTSSTRATWRCGRRSRAVRPRRRPRGCRGRSRAATRRWPAARARDDGGAEGGEHGDDGGADRRRRRAVAVALELTNAHPIDPAGGAAEEDGRERQRPGEAGRQRRERPSVGRTRFDGTARGIETSLTMTEWRFDEPLGCPSMRTLVVLPTYNEAENIVEVLRRLREAAPDAGVLVVDDASPDGTADLAERSAPSSADVEVLRRAGQGRPRLGLPRRLRARHRRGRRRPRRDGRRPVPRPGDLPRCWPPSHTAPTSRSARATCPAGAIPNWSWHRRMLSRWGNRYAAGVLGLAVHDATSGFRAYRADCLKRIDLDAGDGRRLRLPDRDDVPPRAARRSRRRGADLLRRPVRGARRRCRAASSSRRSCW